MRRGLAVLTILLVFGLASGCGQKGDPRPRREIHAPGKKPAPPPPSPQPQQPEKPASE